MAELSETPFSKLKLYSDEETRLRRGAAKRGKKAIEGLKDILRTLEADSEGAEEMLARVDAEIERLTPPDLNKCKEYTRALKRAKKGLPGIDPEDVVLYCSCLECRDVRERFGLDQPEDRSADKLLQKKITEKLSDAAQSETAVQAEADDAPKAKAKKTGDKTKAKSKVEAKVDPEVEDAGQEEVTVAAGSKKKRKSTKKKA